jgi:hypothetical protein
VKNRCLVSRASSTEEQRRLWREAQQRRRIREACDELLFDGVAIPRKAFEALIDAEQLTEADSGDKAFMRRLIALRFCRDVERSTGRTIQMSWRDTPAKASALSSSRTGGSKP